MGVDKTESISLFEGRCAGCKRVKSCTKRIEICAVIDRTIHSACLFGRKKGQITGEAAVVSEFRVFLCKRGGLTESDDLNLLIIWSNQNISGIDVFVDDASLMDRCNDSRQFLGQREETLQIVAAKETRLIQRNPAGIFWDEFLVGRVESRQGKTPGHFPQPLQYPVSVV
ncbi:MAG: hypothetical protein WCK65_12495 [Rhodospirillaceae bacterium]